MIQTSVTSAPAPEPTRTADPNTMKRDVFDHLPEFYKAVATVLIRSGRLFLVDD